MAAFVYTQGETLKISLTITDTDGNAASPSTSMTITIVDKAGTKVVDDQDMTEDATGSYSYNDYTLAADAVTGEYLVEFTANNGGKVSRTYDTFRVQPRKVSA